MGVPPAPRCAIVIAPIAGEAPLRERHLTGETDERDHRQGDDADAEQAAPS